MVYVDDIILVTNDQNKLKEVKEKLNIEFETIDLGEVQKFLGMEVCRDRNTHIIVIHQERMIRKLLGKYKMNKNARKITTPMLTSDASRKMQEENKENELTSEEKFLFRCIAGALLYLSNTTQPDITFAVNTLCRKMDKPKRVDWIGVRRVLRYLNSTIQLGIKFTGKTDTLECYPDATLGLSDVEGKSTTRYAIRLFGDLICWRTKRQTNIAQLLAEAEFMAMSTACKELISIFEMNKQILRMYEIPTIYEDNTAAIKLAKTEECQTLRHVVNLCYHYIRSQVKENDVRLEWISTKEQIGDMFTKALPSTSFCKFRNELMCDYSQLQMALTEG